LKNFENPKRFFFLGFVFGEASYYSDQLKSPCALTFILYVSVMCMIDLRPQCVILALILTPNCSLSMCNLIFIYTIIIILSLSLP